MPPYDKVLNHHAATQTLLTGSKRRSIPGPTTAPDPTLRVARGVAHLLDEAYLDPLLGLMLPGIGDVLASAMGLVLVAIAWRRRMSPVVIARMLLNLALDAGIGAIPVVGDVFDWYFHANMRNLRLLEQHGSRRDATLRDWCLFIAAAVVCGVALLLPLVLLGWAIYVYLWPALHPAPAAIPPP